MSVEILSSATQLYDKRKIPFEKACNRWMTLKVSQSLELPLYYFLLEVCY